MLLRIRRTVATAVQVSKEFIMLKFSVCHIISKVNSMIQNKQGDSMDDILRLQLIHGFRTLSPLSYNYGNNILDNIFVTNSRIVCDKRPVFHCFHYICRYQLIYCSNIFVVITEITETDVEYVEYRHIEESDLAFFQVSHSYFLLPRIRYHILVIRFSHIIITK